MKNAVLTLTRNNLELTKQAIKSIWLQEVETKVFAIDNGSSDGSADWLRDQFCLLKDYPDNRGVSAVWNWGLNCLFRSGYRSVLVINNDIIAPPWFLGHLLDYDCPFVTGVGVDSMGAIEAPAQEFPLQPCPDFSAFLISKFAWDKIGKFDEGMKLYASDVDYHIRGARAGVPMMKANVPYFHAGSATIKNSPEGERQAIKRQADEDRAYFYRKYGFAVGSQEHHKAVGFNG